MDNSNLDAFDYYRRLSRVKRHVEANFRSRFSLEDAANVAGLEKKYFSSYFKSKTGMYFKDWVAGVRIEHAQSMMMKQNYTVTETCFAVGFRDLRTFERAFKKHTGMTPSEFKAEAAPSIIAG